MAIVSVYKRSGCDVRAIGIVPVGCSVCELSDGRAAVQRRRQLPSSASLGSQCQRVRPRPANRRSVVLRSLLRGNVDERDDFVESVSLAAFESYFDFILAADLKFVGSAVSCSGEPGRLGVSDGVEV